jgi:tetratricopeptide (TPR) repeat protein
MIRITRMAAAAAAVFAAVALASPANAQNYSNQFSQAKLTHRADTSVPIAGSGTVVIQVQVNADGSHKVTRIIRSTNPGDNAAAMDIANNSTYSPQHRGKTPVTGFYDYTLVFHGKSVATTKGMVSSGTSAQVDKLIHAGKYDSAKAMVSQALASKPNDSTLNQQLATIDYFMKDYSGAATAFEKVGASKLSKPFIPVAAQSYAMAAVQLAPTDTATAVSFAQKAVTLAPSDGTYYILGSAQVQAGNAAAAIPNLEKARTLAAADSKMNAKARVNIDASLLQAYIKTGDSASAKTIEDEVMRLDPTNTAVKRTIGNQYLAAGNDASKAGKHEDAIASFLTAAKQGDNDVAVTAYASAALEENTILNAQKTPPVPNDYLTKMKPYADQALALNPNDALANYANGVALAGAWIVGGKQKADLKSQALDALNKARAEAQAQGNMSLAFNIDSFIKANIQK